MKGSVTKYAVSGSSRPKWRYRLRIGRNEHGHEIREGKGGYAKEGDAREAMQNRIAEILAQRNAPSVPPKDSGTTLGEWLQKWLDSYAIERCTPKTRERYFQLARYVPESIASAALPALKHAAIETAMYDLLRAPAKRRAHLSARTVRHVAGLLNVALNKAFRLELIPVNPMLRVELPNVQRSQVRSLDPAEISALRDACRGDWTFALVELLLCTGARRGELLALQWTDIDWTTRTAIISKSLEQTATGLRIKSTKSDRPRVCALPQAAIIALQFQRDQQAEHRRQFGREYRDDSLVFCQPDGTRLQPDLVSQVIIRRLRKAGIKDASMHSLRHTHASALLSRGVPLSAVAARLGHSDQTTTLRIYSHALRDDDRRAADAWDALSLPVQ